MPKVEYTIPYPPSINHYYRSNGPRRFISKGGILFRHGVTAAVLEQGLVRLGGGQPISFSMWLYPPDGKKRDADNTIKPTLDALALAGVLNNDYDVSDLHVYRRGVDRNWPRAVVVLDMA